jgi:ribonuclease P protein component
MYLGWFALRVNEGWLMTHVRLTPLDFRCALHSPWKASSEAFAVHYCSSLPERFGQQLLLKGGSRKIWVGCIVPKKLAARAVTRTLIKREMRRWDSNLQHSVVAISNTCLPLEMTTEREMQLICPQGIWVLRLKIPINKNHFPSAASLPLKRWVREQLRQAFEKLLGRLQIQNPSLLSIVGDSC